MDNRRNYYRVLRVQPEAPDGLIKRVYRVMMQHLRLHPDLGGDTQNAALINEAYRAITHPVSRAEHDLALAEQGLTAARIGSGPLVEYPRHAATARHNNINRRHYARVLSVQLDAESPLLDTARAWVLEQRTSETQRTLVIRAHSVLIDPATRGRYTALLEHHSHNGALALLQREAATNAANNTDDDSSAEHTSAPPPPEAGCPYCRISPIPVLTTPEPRCGRCASPLAPPPDLMAPSGRRRRAVRLRKGDSVTLSAGWPARRHAAVLLDASPVGISFLCNAMLHGLPVVRLDGAGLSAVVALTHGNSSRVGNRYGGHIVSATFDNPSGTFFKASA